jgi:chorismate mutase
VIANRRKEALELGLSPDVAESVWRSMIKAFIALERESEQRIIMVPIHPIKESCISLITLDKPV